MGSLDTEGGEAEVADISQGLYLKDILKCLGVNVAPWL